MYIPIEISDFETALPKKNLLAAWASFWFILAVLAVMRISQLVPETVSSLGIMLAEVAS